jgi:hypothetical protein
MTTQSLLCVSVFVLATIVSAVSAYADAALFLEEPCGKMGAMDPTGYAAVYLTYVCASSPTRLRRCRPGEVGVVISRYHRVAGYDWLAIPLPGYLYAVDSFGQESKPIPLIARVSQETLAEMIGTTRSRVSFFMNRFREMGFIEYNGGGVNVHSSLVSVVLHE